MIRHHTRMLPRLLSYETDFEGLKRNSSFLKAFKILCFSALATTSQENQTDGLQTPFNKWQIHRCATPNTTPCQEELVNEWLHRNHIQVVDRLPKMDPVVLVR